MIEGFHAVEWMRKRREEIDREDEGLTWEEKSQKTLEILKNDPLWLRLKNRRVVAVTPELPRAVGGDR